MKKRVKIPMRNTQELLELAKKVRAKHVADGDASPLKVMNWTAINTIIDEAAEMEDLALTLKREKVRIYQQRARRISSVLTIVRNTRDLLTAVHSDEMKQLGQWGFDVLDNRVALPDEEEARPDKA